MKKLFLIATIASALFLCSFSEAPPPEDRIEYKQSFINVDTNAVYAVETQTVNSNELSFVEVYKDTTFVNALNLDASFVIPKIYYNKSFKESYNCIDSLSKQKPGVIHYLQFKLPT